VPARPVVTAVLVCAASMPLAACEAPDPQTAPATRAAGSPTSAEPVTTPSQARDHGWCPRRAPGDPGPPVSYAYALQWSGRSYAGSGRVAAADRRGALLGRVRCDVSTAAFGVDHRLRDGDATFPAGTELYELSGVSPARALLVRRGARYDVFDVIRSKG
jgi:hypothetical protein